MWFNSASHESHTLIPMNVGDIHITNIGFPIFAKLQSEITSGNWCYMMCSVAYALAHLFGNTGGT